MVKMRQKLNTVHPYTDEDLDTLDRLQSESAQLQEQLRAVQKQTGKPCRLVSLHDPSNSAVCCFWPLSQAFLCVIV